MVKYSFLFFPLILYTVTTPQLYTWKPLIWCYLLLGVAFNSLYRAFFTSSPMFQHNSNVYFHMVTCKI